MSRAALEFWLAAGRRVPRNVWEGSWTSERYAKRMLAVASLILFCFPEIKGRFGSLPDVSRGWGLAVVICLALYALLKSGHDEHVSRVGLARVEWDRQWSALGNRVDEAAERLKAQLAKADVLLVLDAVGRTPVASWLQEMLGVVDELTISRNRYVELVGGDEWVRPGTNWGVRPHEFLKRHRVALDHFIVSLKATDLRGES